MPSQETKRQQAAERQRRRRERLKKDGVTVTLPLTHQENAMLDELCQVRRMGRSPYTNTEFIQLLIIREHQKWKKQEAALGKCDLCGKSKAQGGCNGEYQQSTLECWLASGSLKLAL